MIREYYICVTKQNKMKATKKITAEVTAEATAQNVNVEAALSCLERVSANDYKIIGAAGVVEAAKGTQIAQVAREEKGYAFSLCQVLRVTEKAFFLSIPCDTVNKEVWVAKSLIVNDIIPAWVVNR